MGLTKLGQGKVRDLYAVGEDKLLLVASDRISAFDVVMAQGIPDKGRILTQLFSKILIKCFGIDLVRRVFLRAKLACVEQFNELFFEIEVIRNQFKLELSGVFRKYIMIMTTNSVPEEHLNFLVQHDKHRKKSSQVFRGSK